MERKRPRTYEADAGDRKVRVTVPEAPKPEDVLVDAVRDNLSPKAVATIAAYLQPARTLDRDVVRQVGWFRELLIEVVGGDEAFNRLANEVGL